MKKLVEAATIKSKEEQAADLVYKYGSLIMLECIKLGVTEIDMTLTYLELKTKLEEDWRIQITKVSK